MPARTLVRYVWAAPASLLGVVVATAVASWTPTRWRWVDGVVEVCPSHRVRDARRRPRRRFRTKWPFAAITLGHVVVGAAADALDRLRVHEHAHVRQYERWGPAFLLAYPAASLWQWLVGRQAHHDNPFEVQARAEEARSRDRGEA